MALYEYSGRDLAYAVAYRNWLVDPTCLRPYYVIIGISAGSARRIEKVLNSGRWIHDSPLVSRMGKK